MQIAVTPDGPSEVMDLTESGAGGEPIELPQGDAVFLCLGGSTNKAFRDGRIPRSASTAR